MTWFGSAQRQIDLAALTMAGQAATNSAEALGRLDRHEDDCRKYREMMKRELDEHRREVRDGLLRQDAERTSMHAENQSKFEKIFRWQNIGYGVLIAGGLALSEPGRAIIAKLLGH